MHDHATVAAALADHRLSPPTAVAAVVVAACSFQVAAALAIGLFDEVGAPGALVLRQVSGALLLLLLFRPRISRLDARSLRAVLAMGGVVACMNASFYQALERAPLGIVLALEMGGPLAVAVIGARRRSDLVWVALAAVGALVLVLARGVDGRIAPAGVLFAVIAGTCWGLYMVLGARIGKRVPGLDGVAWSVVVAALLTLPLGAPGLVDHGLDLRLVLLGLAIGFVGTAFPYTLEVAALKTLRPAFLGILVAIEPALGALAGFLLQGQVLTLVQVIGIAIVGVAVGGAMRRGVPA